ncbi:MAG TPA: LuxR C-terminal-related transcriptional regulator [Polyangia bacterium]
MRRAPPCLDPDTLYGVLDALDLGVVVCDWSHTHVRYRNAEGARALGLLRARSGRVPAALRSVVTVGEPWALKPGEFTAARELATPTGPRYFVRARPLGDAPGSVLIVLSLARTRHTDVVALVQRRLGLSRRQSEIAALISEGLSNKEIARRQGLAEGTVSQYLVAIYQTLGVRRRSEVVMLVDEVTLSGRREPREE